VFIIQRSIQPVQFLPFTPRFANERGFLLAFRPDFLATAEVSVSPSSSISSTSSALAEVELNLL
jgi:hypothetical protein